MLPVGDLPLHVIVKDKNGNRRLLPTEQYKMPLQNTSVGVDRLRMGADLTDPTAFGTEPGASEWDGAFWLERIEGLIERYPWPTVLLGLGIGYVIARRMR